MISIPQPLTGEPFAGDPSPAVSRAVGTPTAAPAGTPGRGHTVLVVDDDASIRSMTAMLLECLGFRTLQAGDGWEALHVLQRNPQVSVVMLDLLMPVMDGEATFRHLRQSWAGVPVVIISGFKFTEIGRTFANPPPEAFLQKPFTLETLAATLSRVVT